MDNVIAVAAKNKKMIASMIKLGEVTMNLDLLQQS